QQPWQRAANVCQVSLSLDLEQLATSGSLGAAGLVIAVAPVGRVIRMTLFLVSPRLHAAQRINDENLRGDNGDEYRKNFQRHCKFIERGQLQPWSRPDVN